MATEYWPGLLTQALDRLGGREGFVPGATLSFELARLAQRDGVDFRGHLRERGITFRQFLEEHVSIVDLHFVPPPRSDMLVAFRGVPKPTQDRPNIVRRKPRLRQDVYLAFTRITPQPYVYVRGADQFTTDAGDAPNMVAVPAVSLEDLLQERRAFAESLESAESRDTLIRALEFSANPLASFQRTVPEVGELARWHEFSYSTIRKRVEDWAKQNGLEPSASWFAPGADGQRAETPQQILSELARFLTDDEVRGMAVPFRAVEEMYRSMMGKRR